MPCNSMRQYRQKEYEAALLGALGTAKVADWVRYPLVLVVREPAVTRRNELSLSLPMHHLSLPCCRLWTDSSRNASKND